MVGTDGLQTATWDEIIAMKSRIAELKQELSQCLDYCKHVGRLEEERDALKARCNDYAERVFKLSEETALQWEELEAVKAENEHLLDVLKSVEEWWLRDGMNSPGYGAPACIFAVRQILADKGST